MRRFYTHQPLAENNSISLCDDSFHHWVKVLRAKVGEQAVLFNGNGGEYVCELTTITKKEATASVLNFNAANRTNPFKTTLALVMSKGNRMDYALQKATELGVTVIQPLFSERCDVKLNEQRALKKTDSWQKIVISACEQSGLNIVPHLHPPISIRDYLSNQTEIHTNDTKEKRFVMTPAPNNAVNFVQNNHIPSDFSHVTLLIGGEGGLTDDEIKHATDHGFTCWQIGNRVLRTETAPVVALSYLNACYKQT